MIELRVIPDFIRDALSMRADGFRERSFGSRVEKAAPVAVIVAGHVEAEPGGRQQHRGCGNFPSRALALGFLREIQHPYRIQVSGSREGRERVSARKTWEGRF